MFTGVSVVVVWTTATAAVTVGVAGTFVAPVLDKVGEVRVGGDAVVLSNVGKPPVELVTVFVVVVVTLTGIALSKSSQLWIPIL